VLARDGMRNREIADLLGVSVKAVEWHLSHVYRKLGIRSRNDLATGARQLTRLRSLR
jgi:DNA-binding CsgD family transcriptional regulator